MTDGTSIEIGINFREVRKTHVIHAFDVVNGVESHRAICGFEPTSAMTYPLELEDVELNLCKACLKRKTK
jgi:hypothetical protein